MDEVVHSVGGLFKEKKQFMAGGGGESFSLNPNKNRRKFIFLRITSIESGAIIHHLVDVLFVGLISHCSDNGFNCINNKAGFFPNKHYPIN